MCGVYFCRKPKCFHSDLGCQECIWMRLYIKGCKRSTGSVCSDRDQPWSSVSHPLRTQMQLINVMCMGQRCTCGAMNITLSGISTECAYVSSDVGQIQVDTKRLPERAPLLPEHGCGCCHTVTLMHSLAPVGFGERRGQSVHSGQSLLDK